MEFQTFVFYVFATLAVFAGVRVITATNPVHAVLFLVLAFFNVAGLWLLLQAEFLAIALIMVYVGAVMVLFLFVVMMLDINIERLRRGFWSYLPLGLIIGLLLVAEMGIYVSGKYFGLDAMPGQATPPDYSNTKELGRLLFTDYAYPFELASVILLVGIIAAVMLTLRRRTDTKHLDINRQLSVKAADRLRIVKMASEKQASAGEGE
ncbi:MAG TPA: NADH-quinone oxidoreductase subunit J [Rhodocyclaceae bacterium]